MGTLGKVEEKQSFYDELKDEWDMHSADDLVVCLGDFMEDFFNLERTTFCVFRFFYSFTASDGSEGSTAGRVVSPCSIMMHHGFRSNEVRCARKQKYRLRQTTSHSSLLVAHQGDVSRKLNQAFLLVDSFNFNFVDEERSDIWRQR